MPNKKTFLFYCNIFLIISFLAAPVSAKKFWHEPDSSSKKLVDLPSLAPLVKKVSPAVVFISTLKKVSQRNYGNFPFLPPGFRLPPGHPGIPGPKQKGNKQPAGLGTGFLINSKGYILTNNHVIANADEVIVRLNDGSEYKGKIIGRDAMTDMALLKIDTKRKLPYLVLGDSDKLSIGDYAVAVGNPFGLKYTVTMGIISAKGRRVAIPSEVQGYQNFIQTDASINPGNSGGPLLNVKGEVIGINTAINPAGQGIGFAIPISMAKELLPILKQTGRFARSYMGVVIQKVTKDIARSMGLKSTAGAIVIEVEAGSPADIAGLEPEDIVVQFGNKKLMDEEDLRWQAAITPSGKKINLEVIRNGKMKKLAIRLAPFPDGGPAYNPENEAGEKEELASNVFERYGMILRQLSRNEKRQLGKRKSDGLFVENVKMESFAAYLGIEPGDIIYRINGAKIKNVKQVKNLLGKIKQNKMIRFLVGRGQRTLLITGRAP